MLLNGAGLPIVWVDVNMVGRFLGPSSPMHFDYIIVATDLSDYSASAARWAHGVKHCMKAKVVVAHVVELTVANWFSNASDRFEDTSLREQAETNLINWYKDVTGEAPDEVALRLGSPAVQLRALHDALAPEDGALMVVSMSSKNCVHRFLVGSTARLLAAKPPCPLVVVHPEHERLRPSQPIVVGTDFSAQADVAVRCAAKFSNKYAAPLTILHGNPVPPVVVFDGGDLPMGALEESALQWSVEEMGAFERRHEELEPLTYETVVVGDAPGHALMERAKDLDADLLIIGHSGESELAQTVLGSVTQRILNEIPCTLIIVP